MELRNYQKKIYVDVYNQFRSGKKRVLVVAPCGAGKSYLFAAMAESAIKRGNTVLILCHRHELIEQHKQLFADLSIPTDNIRIESIFTEVNHLGEHGTPNLIIVDEAHLSKANSWQKTLEYYNTFVVGFSGTPTRLDNKPLGDIYDVMVESVSVKWLIENHYLAPYDYIAPMTVETDNISVNCGDYSIVELDKLMMDRVIYGDVIANYRKYAENEKTIVYCTSIKHAREVAETFRQAGYTAESIDSSVESKRRDKVMQDFRNGKIKVLCNCGIISEGISITDCAVCILLRPTQSLALHTQQSMRCMRYAPNKVAKIIDCVGNYVRHGLPDTKHDWSLTEMPKKRKVMDEQCNFTIRVCQACFRPFKTAPVCPWCGAKYELAPKEIKAREEVELARITAEKMAEIEQQKKQARMEQGMCKTFEELRDLFVSRGSKWGAACYRARMIMESRKNNHKKY